ncbi:MAG: tetratricopeptide repeat protein [Candidatus Methylomirabilales bacterium]
MITLVALSLALVAIIAIVYPFWRRAETCGDTEGDADDLRMRREKLYDAVRELELEHEAGSVSQEEYARVRLTYEMQAAALLQEEERLGRSRPRTLEKGAPTSTAVASPRPVSHRLGLLVPAAIILVVGLGIGFFLAGSLQPRQAGMSITGDIPSSSLKVADEAFQRGDFRQALEGYKKVLDSNPHEVEALTQIGVILARARHYDDALLAFDQALRVRPNDPRALFEKGLVFFQGKVEPREGIKIWEQLIKSAPPDNEYALTAKRLLEQVRGSMGRPGTPSASPPSK